MKNENNSEFLYESPEMKIYETRVQRAILAASEPGRTDPYEREDWDSQF